MGGSNGRYAVPRPFVKWVGGKRQLLGEMAARQPANFRTYHAPFVGGGAFFFYLVRQGMIRPRMAVLSDINHELMTAYRAVRDCVGTVITHLDEHRNEKSYYYQVRSLDPVRLSPAAAAGRFIYLNKTCYNGLMRYNSQGQFNTPYGYYQNPTICDRENLAACAQALELAHLAAWDFEAVLDNARSGDFVYCDPPFFPLSETANFTEYTAGGFSVEDQKRLAAMVHRLTRMGVYVMASNHDVPQVHQLYQGLRIERVTANRAINSKGSRRGPVPEVLITNY